MSSSLISALSGGEEAAFQEQLKRQFRENLAKDPKAMEAYNKATGNETPWYSPSSLRAMENERQAAARRSNQMARGAQAIRETAIAQGRNVAVSPEGRIQISDPDPAKALGRFAVRPSGLMQSQVEELPGGFKAVYDREGRLVGTNAPVQVKADAATKSPGEGTVAEGQSLRAAMDKAVRAAQQARPAAATPAEAGFTPLGGAAEQVVAEESAFMPPLPLPLPTPTPLPTPPAPTSPQGPETPLPPEVASMLFGEEPFSQAAQREQRDDAARARTSRQLDRVFAGKKPAAPKPESGAAANLMGRGLVPEVQQGLFSSMLGLSDLYSNYLGRPLDRFLFGIPIPEQPSQLMEEYQRSLGRPTGWTGGL